MARSGLWGEMLMGAARAPSVAWSRLNGYEGLEWL